MKKVITKPMENLPTHIQTQPNSLQISSQTLIIGEALELREDAICVSKARHLAKIKDMSEKDRPQIGIRLLAWAKMLGVKEPDPMLIAEAVPFLQNHFGDFHTDEISYAIELAIAGKIDCKVEHFQSFNVKYLSNILIAYRIYRLKQFGLERKRLDSAKLMEVTRPLTEEELKKRREDNYSGLVEFVMEHGKLPTLWGWADAYQHMEETGLLKASNEEKQIFAAEVRRKQMEQIDKRKEKDFQGWKEAVKNINDKNYFKELCRIEFVKNHFQKTIDQ